MRDDEFDSWFDEDSASDVSPSGSIDALEQWLEKNYRLWELGLQLAEQAQYYRREYAYIPFNNSGWFSPN